PHHAVGRAHRADGRTHRGDLGPPGGRGAAPDPPAARPRHRRGADKPPDARRVRRRRPGHRHAARKQGGGPADRRLLARGSDRPDNRRDRKGALAMANIELAIAHRQTTWWKTLLTSQAILVLLALI